MPNMNVEVLADFLIELVWSWRQEFRFHLGSQIFSLDGEIIRK
jgi:hypothetical protein